MVLRSSLTSSSAPRITASGWIGWNWCNVIVSTGTRLLLRNCAKHQSPKLQTKTYSLDHLGWAIFHSTKSSLVRPISVRTSASFAFPLFILYLRSERTEQLYANFENLQPSAKATRWHGARAFYILKIFLAVAVVCSETFSKLTPFS